MKKTIIISLVVVILGLLIALGPQFLFKICSPHSSTYPLCFWSARAELGVGMLIAALGICLFVFNDPKTQIGLIIGVFLSGILVIGIPFALIGGCKSSEMACKRIAFPSLLVEGIILLVFSILIVIYNEMKKPS